MRSSCSRQNEFYRAGRSEQKRSPCVIKVVLASVQATCTRIMFPGEPLPRRGAARTSRTAAQTTHATQRSQGADSCPPPAARSRARSRVWSPDTHGWSAGGHSFLSARESVQLPMPTSSSQVQPPLPLPERGVTRTAQSCKSIAFPVGLQEQAGQLTARPQEAQPERELPHSSADTVSLARSSHDNTELSDHMTAPQQQQKEAS